MEEMQPDSPPQTPKLAAKTDSGCKARAFSGNLNSTAREGKSGGGEAEVGAGKKVPVAEIAETAA